MFCVKCGAEIDDSAIACPKCGVPTKNFKRGAGAAAKVKTTVNVSANSGTVKPTAHPSTFAESWKFAVGLLIILFGASAFVQGWKVWSWGVLAASTISILGGAMLFAWGIVGVRTKLRAKETKQDKVYL